MGNLSIKLNLKQLKHKETELIAKDGRKIKCLIIPIAENKLYEGEKGVYLDITGHEIKERKNDSKDTHLLKQSFTKEVYEAMSDEEKQSYPILGNVIVWGRQEATPVQSQELQSTEINLSDADDLPF